MEKIINIELKSYISFFSGESDLFVDSDIVIDFVGLPIAKGKTLKGLLKESMEEVLEKSKQSDIRKTLDKWFGKSGHNYSEQNAIIKISNGTIPNYKETFLEILNKNIPLEDVKEYYTKIISQTALNDDGTAKDGSLRFTRAINPLKLKHLEFVVEFSEKFDKKLDEELWTNTLLNLRRAGLNRNRGLGKIKLTEKSSISTEENTNTNTDISLKTNQLLEIKVELEKPVILNKQIGEQNTIYTEDVISGNKILGLLAFKYLKNNSNEVDGDFLDLFVKEKVQIGYLTKDNSKIIPKNIVLEKYEEEKYFNVFDKQQISKKVDDYYVENNEGIQISKTDKMFSFHHKRANRIAGSSTKNEGNIYYYEYLVPFQNFEGKMEGEVNLLQKLIVTIGTEITGYIGSSKNAQYGKVNISFSVKDKKEKKEQIDDDDYYYLVLETPVLIYNNKGIPSMKLEDFAVYLNLSKDDIKENVSSFSNTQNYHSLWGSKTKRETVWAEGSCFKISNNTVNILPDFIGEGIHKGLGKYSIYSNSEMNELINKLNNIKKEEPIKLTKEIKKYNTSFTKEIISDIILEDNIIKLTKEAKKYSTKIKALKISNSLLYKLMMQLKNETNYIKWINGIEKKKAGKTFSSQNIYKDLKYSENNKNTFEEFAIKWTAFAKQVVIKNNGAK